MKAKITFLLCFLLLVPFASALAQMLNVNGTVTDNTGEPLMGVSVLVKGTPTGCSTDLDGNFTIKAEKGSTLLFSYVGMDPQEVKVENENHLDIVMKENATALDEVVVTALGIKREKKALGYAVTEIKGEDLNANVVNPVSALQGKVAGVEINQSDGGLFGNNKILIRGASTLGANNQPIYVVDGIILDNGITNGDPDYSDNNSDYGNELKNLNPQDFESVSVLKGAAATALYGSRGLNGVVVITTKSGKGKKGLGINFSQTFGVDWMISQPKLQNIYGPGAQAGSVTYSMDQGSKFNTNKFLMNADGERTLIGTSSLSWGPAFDGKPIEYYDGTIRPYQAYENNYKDSHRAGFNSTTNLAINGGNETTNFYVSLGYKYAEGLIWNNDFNRFNFMTKASHKLNDNITVEAGVTFANSTPRNAAINLGQYFVAAELPRTYDAAGKRHYKGEHGGLASSTYGDEYGEVLGRGLWWGIFENDYKRKETVVRPNLKLTIDATDWLRLSAEGSYNYYYTRYENKQPGSGYANEGGYYGLGNTTKEQTNANINANLNKRFGDWEAHGFVRGEYYHSFSQSMAMNTNGGLIIPNAYFITNSKNTPGYSGEVSGTKTIWSVAAQVGGSWKDQLYLDFTARNDWSSSLVYADQHGTYSYFYPSVSGSWLISSSFEMPAWISFAKLRASWAQVGNDTDPYVINNNYVIHNSIHDGTSVPGAEPVRNVYSKNLKPERKNSWEIGLDWRMFNNRFGIDATYYKENTKDQIMTISVPSVSGMSNQTINAGNIQNQGVELAINGTMIESRDWTWDATLTYTKNKSKIIALHPNVANYIGLSGDPAYGNFRIGSVAKVGGEYGLLMSDAVRKIDEASGLPILAYRSNSWESTYYVRDDGNVHEIGSINPDFLGSFQTNLRYKNWNLHVALDGRFGGYVASYGSRYGTCYGYTETSLKGRDAAHGGVTFTSRWDGTEYHDGVIPDGIFPKGLKISQPDGTMYEVGAGQFNSGETFKELLEKGKIEPTHASAWTRMNNNWSMSGQDYGSISDDWFHKLNYISLREVSLSYTCPQFIASKIGAKSLSLTASGHNLGYLLNSLPNKENPESVRGTSASEFRIRNYDGTTASFTFTINASF